MKTNINRNAETLRQIFSVNGINGLGKGYNVHNVNKINKGISNPKTQQQTKTINQKDSITFDGKGLELEKKYLDFLIAMYSNSYPQTTVDNTLLNKIFTSLIRKYLRDKNLESKEDEIKQEVSKENPNLTDIDIATIVRTFIKYRKIKQKYGKNLFEYYIGNSKRNQMKTRKEYETYYLNELNELFPGLTQADYNSAKEYCRNEEWDLSDTDSVEGLNDAWKEYQKRFGEGFEVMNNRQIKSGYERNTESIRKIFSSVMTADVEKYILDDYSFGFWGVPDIKSDEELSRRFDAELDTGDYIAAYLSAKENGVDISSKNEEFFQGCLEQAKPENNWWLRIHDEYIKDHYENATHGHVGGKHLPDLKKELNNLKQELDSTEPWKENKIIRLQYKIDEKEAEIKGYQQYLDNRHEVPHNRYHDDYADLYWQGKAPEHYNRYMAKLKARYPGSF